ISSIESATQIENEEDRVDVHYGLGVRIMGIAYSESNSLGGGLKEENDGELTSVGPREVKHIHKIGMTIDISHCDDQTQRDVSELSEKPIFMTHVGARALWNINRLMPDDALKACAEKGGVIGIEAAPHTTLTKKHPNHSIESVMEHFEYTAN